MKPSPISRIHAPSPKITLVGAIVFTALVTLPVIVLLTLFELLL